MNTTSTESFATKIEVGFLVVGQSCFYANELFQVLQKTNGNAMKLESIRRVINLDAFTVVQDPKLENGEPMTEDQKQNQINANLNNITLKQIDTMNYSNASAIISTKEFNTVAEYVEVAQVNAPSLAWDTVKDWRSLCNILGIDFNTVAKGKARPAIDKVATELHGKEKAKTAVSTKVKMNNSVIPQSVTTSTVDALTTPTVSTGAPAIKPVAVLPKSPKRSDYPKDEQGEDDFDAAMTEWILIKKAIEAGQAPAVETVAETVAAEVVTETAAPAVETVAEAVAVETVAAAPAVETAVAPAVAEVVAPKATKTKKATAVEPVAVEPVAETALEVAPVVDGDNIEETAMQLARLLSDLKPKAGKVNAEDILNLVNQRLADFEENLEDKYSSAVTNGLDGLLKSASSLIAQELAAAKASMIVTQTIEVKVNGAEGVQIKGKVHERFSDILAHVSVRDNVMLVGPAGSGKTTVCENVAEALGLDFYCKSVCAQTSKSELLGYMDANGQFVSTEFRVAYQNGGVFVLDEIDAGNPNVIAVLNSALANSYCAFADGMIRKHDDFVLIACANTFGTGASREYVGRNQLDSATLDRFSVIEFGYDEKLELAISADKKFCKFVQAVRKDLIAERIVISPRASIQGSKLLLAGCTPEYVVQTRIIKGMAANLKERVMKVFAIHYPKATATPAAA